MKLFFLDFLGVVFLSEMTPFAVLKWGVVSIVPALVLAIGVLWRAKNNSDKEFKSYIREEAKENAAILNGLSEVLSDLANGVNKDLPRDINDVKDSIDRRADEIKEFIKAKDGK